MGKLCARDRRHPVPRTALVRGVRPRKAPPLRGELRRGAGARLSAEIVTSWLIFPVVTGSLWLGCGLLVESLSGARVPGALLPVCGFGAIIAVGQFLTLGEAT